jgi:hypothetical protein
MAKLRSLAKDHTNIVKIVLENPLHVTRLLDSKKFILERKRPSPEEILQALLKMEKVDPRTKRKIRKVISFYPKLVKAQAELDADQKASIARVVSKIDRAKNAGQIIKILQRTEQADEFAQDEVLRLGIDFSIMMLRDGSKSIYVPEFHRRSYAAQRDAEDRAASVGKEDAKGAVAGAVGGAAAGAVAGGVGAGPGAVAGGLAGGLTSSVAECVSQIWDSIFG